jgi:phosphoribosylaminoimidazolecarboxamide formyltransferase/IMP cyclohydrolase
LSTTFGNKELNRKDFISSTHTDKMRKIKNALISVFHKDGLDEIIHHLASLNIAIYSTGGTYDYIHSLGVQANKVEDLTSYPSILGGRVKTLHPKVFGGILARRELNEDLQQLDSYEIPEFDLVIVDLYPFEKTLASTQEESAIIEKIDIGGISLIRAAAKNYKDVVIISSSDSYADFLTLLSQSKGYTTLAQRQSYAAKAFAVSSHYDSAIFHYFNQQNDLNVLRLSHNNAIPLRYGENPHQNGYFFGALDEVVEQLSGKEISYNNILDIDAAIRLINDFEETTFAILKHNNACGIASRPTVLESWEKALEGDPISAFGGVLICNAPIDLASAHQIDQLFYEVLIAPAFDQAAEELLSKKSSRILLKLKKTNFDQAIVRTALNGVLVQTPDLAVEQENNLRVVTKESPSNREFQDLIFANKIVKHTKSNAMVIVRYKQLIASGVGETSRVDAFKQAIEKAENFKKSLAGAVLASDAFFPFSDNVEIANSVGIHAIVQPGGSKKDQDSIDYCNQNGLAMCFTGTRHFKH